MTSDSAMQHFLVNSGCLVHRPKGSQNQSTSVLKELDCETRGCLTYLVGIELAVRTDVIVLLTCSWGGWWYLPWWRKNFKIVMVINNNIGNWLWQTANFHLLPSWHQEYLWDNSRAAWVSMLELACSENGGDGLIIFVTRWWLDSKGIGWRGGLGFG